MEDEQGQTPYHFALRKRSFDTLRLLCGSGEEIADVCMFTELHAAVALPFSDTRLTSELLDGALKDVNTLDGVHMTPLHWACRMGDPVATEALLA